MNNVVEYFLEVLKPNWKFVKKRLEEALIILKRMVAKEPIFAKQIELEAEMMENELEPHNENVFRCIELEKYTEAKICCMGEGKRDLYIFHGIDF